MHASPRKKKRKKKKGNEPEQLPNECLIILASFHVPRFVLWTDARCYSSNVRLLVYAHFSLVSIRSSIVRPKFCWTQRKYGKQKIGIFLFSGSPAVKSRPSVEPTSVNIYCPFAIRCVVCSRKIHHHRIDCIVGVSSALLCKGERESINFFFSPVVPPVRPRQTMKRPANAEFSHACALCLGGELSRWLHPVLRLANGNCDSPVPCALYAVNEARECA